MKTCRQKFERRRVVMKRRRRRRNKVKGVYGGAGVIAMDGPMSKVALTLDYIILLFWGFGFFFLQRRWWAPCEKRIGQPDAAGAGLSWFTRREVFIPPLIKDVIRAQIDGKLFFFCGGGGTMMIQQKKNPRTNGRKEREMCEINNNTSNVSQSVQLLFFFRFFMYILKGIASNDVCR